MNGSPWLTDELIEAAFEGRAARAGHGDLGETILATTAAIGQRSAWRLRLAAAMSRPVLRPAWVAILVLAALLGLALALALIGTQQPPFRTGLLAFVRDGDVYLANPDGSDPRVVLHRDGVSFGALAWSPDGSRLAVDAGSGVVVWELATGTASYIGPSFSPAWSPDGRQLAVRDFGEPGDEHVRIVDAANLSTLKTYALAGVGDMTWSPNGRWIAATGQMVQADEFLSSTVVRLDVATGEVVQVDGPAAWLDQREIAWSPDSRQLAFIRLESNASPAGCDLAAFTNDQCEPSVFVADADGSNIRPLRPAPAPTPEGAETGPAISSPGGTDLPRWSSDGGWIAFRLLGRGVAERGIAVVHPDGTGERTVIPGAVDDYAWSPEADRLIYAVPESGSTAAIWQSTLDGERTSMGISVANCCGFLNFAWQALGADNEPNALPSATGAPPAPSLTVATPPPAGPANPSQAWQTLALHSDEPCEYLLVATATLDVTRRRDYCERADSLDADGWAFAWAGSWSPDGSAYAAVLPDGLAIAYADGRVVFGVADLGGHEGGPIWSPDGAWLGVSSERSFIVRPDGSDRREVSGRPSWTPDGGTLAVARNDGMLLVGPADGSSLRSIGEFPEPEGWSADGSRFVFVRDGDVWTARSDGTDVRRLASLLGAVQDVLWSPDGEWIAVVAWRGVLLVRPDGSERRWLDTGVDSFSVTWSPNSTRLAAGANGGMTIIHVDGSSIIRIPGVDVYSWSPDGRFLAALGPHLFEDRPRFGYVLQLMTADGSGRRFLELDADFDPSAEPVWVP